MHERIKINQCFRVDKLFYLDVYLWNVNAPNEFHAVYEWSLTEIIGSIFDWCYGDGGILLYEHLILQAKIGQKWKSAEQFSKNFQFN